MSWISALPGLRDVYDADGELLPRAIALRVGAGLAVEYDPAARAWRLASVPELPDGGLTGQFLTIDSNGDPAWATSTPGDATSLRGVPLDAAIASVGAGEDGYALTYDHASGEFTLAPGGGGGGGGGYETIENNGTPVTQRATLNLPSASALVAADSGGKTTLSVSGIANTHVDAAAAIAGTKIAPDFGAQSITTTGNALLGSTPRASAGAVRMPASAALAWRNAGDSNNNTIAWSSDICTLTASSTTLLSVGATTVAIEAAATFGFASSIASPTITQAAVGDAAGQTLTVRAQGNNSGSSAAGDLEIGGGTNAGAGADGVTRVLYGSSRVAEFGPTYVAVGAAPGSGSSASASTGTVRVPRDFTLYARNNGDTADVELLSYAAASNSLTVATNSVLTLGGNTAVQLRVGGTVRVSVGGSAVDIIVAACRFNSTVVTPAFGQSTATGASATGQPLELHAQDCSGTTSVTAGKITLRAGDATGASGTRNGGALLLRAGRGATSDGNIALHADPSSWQSMQRGVFIGNRAAAPSGNPADGGYLYAESGELWWRSSAGVSTQLT